MELIAAEILGQPTHHSFGGTVDRMSETTTPAGEMSDQAAWNARYAERSKIWSGSPNAALVQEAESLTPGRALELGCGEGADAIWLAQRGWHVTGVDISTVALDRAARHAADLGVADRIDWQCHVLGESFPSGGFDLITAMFLHSWGDLRREEILQTAAGAVAPGGTLLIVGHSRHPQWHTGHHPKAPLPAPDEVLESLALDSRQWEVLRCEEFDSPAIRPDGEQDVRQDSVLNVRRLID